MFLSTFHFSQINIRVSSACVVCRRESRQTIGRMIQKEYLKVLYLKLSEEPQNLLLRWDINYYLVSQNLPLRWDINYYLVSQICHSGGI